MKHLAWLLCVILLSGCSSLKFWENDDEDEDSPTKMAELVSFDEEVTVRKLWRTSAGSGQKGYLATLHPDIDGEVVYAATSAGAVVALNTDDGAKLWRTELDTSLSGGVGLGGGLVLVGNAEGEVIALDADSGSEKWRSVVSSEVLAAPAANAEIVAVQTQDSKLYGLSANDGKVVWRLDVDVPVLTLHGTGSPVVTDTMVVSGFANGKVFGVEGATGALLWESRIAVPKGRTELERMVDVNTPLLHDDVIYASSYQGRVGALSRGTGRELWFQDSSSVLRPAYGLDQVYVVESDDRVRALRGTSGQELWSNDQLKNRKLNAPAVAGGYLAVGDSEGYLHILSQVDGHFVARIRVDGDGLTVPMAADGETLYVLDNSGDVTAYRFEGK